MTATHFYHIVTPAEWERFLAESFYEAPSLATEGFIHASTAEQVEATLNRYYKNEPVAILLTIEAAKLQTELKYELAPSVQEYFPHIYGRLNKDAISNITNVYRNKDGLYKLDDQNI